MAKLTFPFIELPCKVAMFRENEAYCLELTSVAAMSHMFNMFWLKQNQGRGGLYRIEFFRDPNGVRHTFYIRVPNFVVGERRLNAHSFHALIMGRYHEEERRMRPREDTHTVPIGMGIMWELLV